MAWWKTPTAQVALIGALPPRTQANHEQLVSKWARHFVPENRPLHLYRISAGVYQYVGEMGDPPVSFTHFFAGGRWTPVADADQAMLDAEFAVIGESALMFTTGAPP